MDNPDKALDSTLDDMPKDANLRHGSKLTCIVSLGLTGLIGGGLWAVALVLSWIGFFPAPESIAGPLPWIFVGQVVATVLLYQHRLYYLAMCAALATLPFILWPLLNGPHGR